MQSFQELSNAHRSLSSSSLAALSSLFPPAAATTSAPAAATASHYDSPTATDMEHPLLSPSHVHSHSFSASPANVAHPHFSLSPDGQRDGDRAAANRQLKAVLTDLLNSDRARNDRALQKFLQDRLMRLEMELRRHRRRGSLATAIITASANALPVPHRSDSGIEIDGLASAQQQQQQQQAPMDSVLARDLADRRRSCMQSASALRVSPATAGSHLFA